MDNSTADSGTVKLFSGAEVAAVEVLVTLGKLKGVLDQALRGQILLGELHTICEGDGRGDVDEAAVQALISKHFLCEDGRVSANVRAVVRAAVQRKTGTTLWTVCEPYPHTPANVEAVQRAAGRMLHDMGLDDLASRGRLVAADKKAKDA